jgi:hypothetical protein
VGVLGSLIFGIMIVCVFCPDLGVFFFLRQEFINIYLQLDLAQFDQINFLSMVIFLVENVPYE